MFTSDPGSFRDPTSRVLHVDGRVLRVLRGAGSAGWEALQQSDLLERLVDEGQLVHSEQVDLPPHLACEGWEVSVEHERIPFVSYPYEWPFSMLQEAARLQLDVLLEALGSGLTLKDATPYNIQWVGSRPVFIDVGSFQEWEEGEPWLGYRQFCRLFLFPLMLRAFRDVAFQPWLRGSLEGIAASDLRKLLSFRDRWRRAVLLHVTLQARVEARSAGASESTRDEVRRAGFRKELIETNARGLRRLVDRIRWRSGTTAWSGYAEGHEHVRLDRGAKTDFVRAALMGSPRRLVWDLGANDGHFSRIAAENAAMVVAMDADEATIDGLYRSLRAEQHERILTLLVDLADPSPAMGWAGQERPSLPVRGRPDFVLCLAVLHHLTIGRNVAPERFVAWLGELGAEVVLEFAEREDPMVRRLTLNKRADEIHASYGLEAIRKLMAQHFHIVREERLPSGHRTLLHARPPR